MEPMTLGLLILGLTVLLILLRMPVGTAMFLCGAAGFVYVVGSVEVRSGAGAWRTRTART